MCELLAAVFVIGAYEITPRMMYPNTDLNTRKGIKVRTQNSPVTPHIVNFQTDLSQVLKP